VRNFLSAVLDWLWAVHFLIVHSHSSPQFLFALVSLFRTRQPFLQTNAWQNQALNALHYNTSQQGSVVPLCYGTVRQQINLLDLANYMGPSGKKGKTGSLPITGTANTAKGGGGSKGKGSKKAPQNFSVDVMFGICQGPTTGSNFTSVYSSSGVLSGSGGLNYYSGQDGQAVDPVFNRLGHSVNYSGTTVASATPMDLGPSPVIPNLSVEIPAILVGTATGGYSNDANPAFVIEDFLTNPRYGAEFPLSSLDNLEGTGNYGDYCQASQLLISPTLDGHQKAIEYLDQITKLTNSTLVWSGKILKVIPWGDLALNSNGTSWTPNLTPVYSFTDDHFIPWQPREAGSGPRPGEEDPILVTRKNPADAYNWFSIEYNDRGNFYNSTTLTVSDQGAIDQYGLRIGDTIQGRAFASVTSAQISAQLILQRSQYVRNSPYRFQVGWQFSLLEPMDIVLLSGRMGDIYLKNQPVRVTSVEEDENGNLIVEGEEIQVGASPPPPIPVTLATDTFAANNGNNLSSITVVPERIQTPGFHPMQFITVVTHSVTPPTVTGITDDYLGGGVLVWHHRFSYLATPTPGDGVPINLEVWWADTTSVPSGTIIHYTVSLSNSADMLAVWVTGVSGNVDTSTFWDTNSSLPVKTTGTAVQPEATGVSTSATGAMLISWIIGTDTSFNSWVTVGWNGPIWSSVGGGIVGHYGFANGSEYFNILSSSSATNFETQFSGFTAVPFAYQPSNNPNINPNNKGYMIVVDAIAGT
jgi:hypothetical protein